MIELNIVGVGAWGEGFSNWPELQSGFSSGAWAEQVLLSPSVIPARERRRASQSVKMAVEVMGQACEMAGMDPSLPAVVCASAMGEMQITENLCRTLADDPSQVSPTRFHNSVHNAPIGYWSIATGSHASANAVGGHDHSAALGLLEAAAQAQHDDGPVIFVSFEVAAPPSLFDARPSKHPLALAMLLAPLRSSDDTLARISLDLVQGEYEFSKYQGVLPVDYSGNPTAVLLPLFKALAAEEQPGEPRGWSGSLPLSGHCALAVKISDCPDAGFRAMRA
jgi:hypothetical protein